MESQVPAWLALVLALVAAASPFVTVWLTSKHEHKHWLRAEQLSVYVDALHSLEELFHQAQSPVTDLDKNDAMYARLFNTQTRLKILAPKELQSLFYGVMMETQEMQQHFLKERHNLYKPGEEKRDIDLILERYRASYEALDSAILSQIHGRRT